MNAVTAERPADRHEHLASTIVTMQLGVALAVLLGLMFFSGGLFFLYVFNFNIGPYFTATRLIHFYVGLASIPFLLAKYGSTTYRLAGYYLHLPRFKQAGPPKLIPRIFSPLLALDFFVLYFSGLYMLFHYYYTVANIPPLQFKPVQLHLWASLVAVPLLAIHLGYHLFEAARGLAKERRELRAIPAGTLESRQRVLSRRGFVGAVLVGGLGLAAAFQNTPLANGKVHGLFIGQIPPDERGGPGGFPTETLFGKAKIDTAAWRLKISGAVAKELNLTYEQFVALPSVTQRIRINCVSGWSDQPVWQGPRVRDVLALALTEPSAKSVEFHSVTKYGWTWRHELLLGDEALLATHVNGAPLSETHGFPVRLILPGYPGENMIKQLDSIIVHREAEKFDPDFVLTA